MRSNLSKCWKAETAGYKIELQSAKRSQAPLANLINDVKGVSDSRGSRTGEQIYFRLRGV